VTSDSLTMRQLEEHPEQPIHPRCSLEEWYVSVRDTPIRDLSVGDLARAIRQKLFLHALVPLVVERPTADPLAGDIYDGELLVALRNIPKAFWMQRVDLRDGLASVLSKVVPGSLDEEWANDVDAIRRMITLQSEPGPDRACAS
jgi:hypothetical protein